MSMHTPYSLYEALQRIIGNLPKYTIEANISLSANKIPEVSVLFHPETAKGAWDATKPAERQSFILVPLDCEDELELWAAMEKARINFRVAEAMRAIDAQCEAALNEVGGSLYGRGA